MHERTCEWCGELYIGKSNSRYCKRDHYKDCEWCNTSFLIRRIKSPAKACSPECAKEIMRHGGKREHTCELCEKTFLSRNPRARFCTDDHYKACANCGEQFKIYNPHIIADTCSKSCTWSVVMRDPEVQARHKATIKERYGVENVSQAPDIKEKKRQSALARYGVENPSQAPEVQEKRVRTFYKHYGTDHPMKHPAVQAKGKATMMERYGVENIFASEQFQTDLKALMLERYGVENILQLPEHQLKAARSTGRRMSKVNKDMHRELLDRFGVDCTLEAPFGQASYADLGYKNLLVDLNPTATHNTTISFLHLTGRCTVENCQKPSHAPRPAAYHHDRVMESMANGDTLLQMFAWHDQEQFVQIVRRHLYELERLDASAADQGLFSPSSLLGYTVLRPEQTTAQEVSAETASTFFQQYHIDGAGLVDGIAALADNAEHTYPESRLAQVGVYHGDLLVHVHRYMALDDQGHWQVVQYGSHHDYIVEGGFQQCQQLFVQQYTPRTLLCVTDLAVDQGDALLANGWEIADAQAPESVTVPLGGEPVTVWDAGAHVLTWDAA